MTKSNAQLRRLQKRAAQRGEEYTVPEDTDTPATTTPENQEQSDKDQKSTQAFAIAKKLVKQLAGIEKDESLKAKDRRSAKRKAEAIASDEAGIPVADLLELYEKHLESLKEQKQLQQPQQPPTKKRKKASSKKKNPYIVFVGQLSYDTTAEALLKHFEQELGEEHTINNETVQFRLLKDPKTGKSRGMAFVEFDNPELLYASLKLHHTHLEGRRINVERSAGGRGEKHQEKVKQLRSEQNDYIKETVEKMLGEFKKTGDIRENELDEGVVQLMYRHSPHIVQASLEHYVEKGGKDMDNPSAYMSFLLGKFAQDGVLEKDTTGKPIKNQRKSLTAIEREKEKAVTPEN